MRINFFQPYSKIVFQSIYLLDWKKNFKDCLDMRHNLGIMP